MLECLNDLKNKNYTIRLSMFFFAMMDLRSCQTKVATTKNDKKNDRPVYAFPSRAFRIQGQLSICDTMLRKISMQSARGTGQNQVGWPYIPAKTRCRWWRRRCRWRHRRRTDVDVTRGEQFRDGPPAASSAHPTPAAPRDRNQNKLSIKWSIRGKRCRSGDRQKEVCESIGVLVSGSTNIRVTFPMWPSTVFVARVDNGRSHPLGLSPVPACASPMHSTVVFTGFVSFLQEKTFQSVVRPWLRQKRAIASDIPPWESNSTSIFFVIGLQKEKL